MQLGCLWELCELPQRGLRRSPSRNRISYILALKYDIWWYHLGPTVVDSYAKKPLVHYWPRTTYVLNWQNCIGINVRTCPLLMPWGVASQSGSGALYRIVNVYIYGHNNWEFRGPCVPPPLAVPLLHCSLQLGADLLRNKWLNLPYNVLLLYNMLRIFV